MEIKDFGLLLVILVVSLTFVLGLSFGSYKYGRVVERKALTEALTNTIEATYYAGRGDAETDCRQGWIK